MHMQGRLGLSLSPPKEKAGCNTGLPELSTKRTRAYVLPAKLQASAIAQWRLEGRRMLREYRRSGAVSHLKAFFRHRAAMGGRLRSAKVKEARGTDFGLLSYGRAGN